MVHTHTHIRSIVPCCGLCETFNWPYKRPDFAKIHVKRPLLKIILNKKKTIFFCLTLPKKRFSNFDKKSGRQNFPLQSCSQVSKSVQCATSLIYADFFSLKNKENEILLRSVFFPWTKSHLMKIYGALWFVSFNDILCEVFFYNSDCFKRKKMTSHKWRDLPYDNFTIWFSLTP